jgi:hypothetical protein
LGRVAKFIGILAFSLTEAMALFGTWIVASFHCCAAVQEAGPQGAEDWATIAVFAVVMIIPAAMVGIGAAVAAHAATMLVTAAAARWKRRHRKR